MKIFRHTWLLVFLLLGGFSSAFCQHYFDLGGTFSHDSTLRKLGEDSAYLVTQSIIVPAGVTLAIDPGVVAYFSQNAALNVNGGSLLVRGTENDSVKLLCYELSRDWLGVQLKNIADTCRVDIRCAAFRGAVSAISLSNARNVSVTRCEFYNYYGGKGVVLTDCSGCTIDSCFFYQCLSSIELLSVAANSVGNCFSNNVFDRGQINLKVSNTCQGYYCYGNYVKRNCFQGASTALYFEAYGELSFRNRKNFIQHNIISSDLPDEKAGYLSFGLKTSMDSLMLQHNIFWNNDEAVRMLKPCDLFFDGNTFYDNGSVLSNAQDQCTIRFANNVFSKISNGIMEIPSNLVTFRHNNFLSYGHHSILLKNNTSSAIDLRENYWQVMSADSIEKLLIDDNDNPQLGPIVFDDFLLDCDTAAPVSPPHDVKIQLVKGEWRISWDQNPEADIDHYALYYGGLSNYRFEHHIDGIQENSIAFEPESETIAVAAFDGDRDPDEYALKGKSAFAFADYYPYPGADSSLCVGSGELHLDDASIPYAYDSFYWSTSGTGAFSDSTALHPYYLPSAADFESLFVELTLNVVSDGKTKSSSLHLDLKPIPDAFAGNDYYSGIHEPIVLNEAFASFYDSVFWKSFGDGRFSDVAAVNPEYYPGNLDLESGSVTLVLSAFSVCGEVTDTVTYALLEEYSMEGRVWLGDIPKMRTVVVAASVEESELPYVSGFYRTATDANGYFHLDNLIAGTYVLYAFADTLEHHSGTAYYLNAQQWQDAVHIQLNGDAYDIDVKLLPIVPDFLVGQGSIAGAFTWPDASFKAAGFFCRSWFEGGDSLNYCDGGLSNIGVSLMNVGKDRLFGFALTDAEGHFRFGDLPYGTYVLMADLPRYGQGISETIVLAPGSENIDSIRLSLGQGGRIVVRGIPQPAPAQSDFCIVPNPVHDELYLLGLPAATCRIRVLNCEGVEMLSQYADRIPDFVRLDTTTLPHGLYVVVVEGDGYCETTKFIKE